MRGKPTATYETITPPGRVERRVFLTYAVIVLVGLVIGLATEQYAVAGLPVLAWVLVTSFTEFRTLFYLLLCCIPVSFDITFGGLGTDLPTEPLALGLTGLFLLHALRHWSDYARARFFHPIALLLYLHVGWIGFTAFFSSVPITSFKFLAAKLWYVGGYFLVPLLLIRLPNQVRTVVHCIFWPLLLVALQALLRHASYGFSFADQFRTMSPFFSEHVSYAACLATFMPWVLYLRWWRGRNERSTWWLTWIALPVLLAAIFFSFTRAAIVALFLAGIGYFVIQWKLIKPLALAALAGAILGVGYMIQDNRYLELAPDFNTTISHDEYGNLISATYQLEDISTMERLYRWVAGGHMVPYRPVLGWGPGTFLENYKSYTVRSFRTYVSDNEGRSGIHSYYLMTLVEQGFPGLAIYLAYVLGALFIGQRLYHEQRDPAARAAIMAALLALLIVDAFNIINDQMETDKVGSQYLINLAIIISMALYRPSPPGEELLTEAGPTLPPPPLSRSVG